MKVLGITGGIGSGKSVVSKILEVMKVPVYNSDREAKKITASSLLIREKLVEKFGSQLYANGELDKALLASFIFNNPDHLTFVNSIIHPEVHRDFSEWMQKNDSYLWVGIESAILFESGFDRYVDLSMLVLAPLELRIQRIQKRDALDKNSILNRIKNQMSDEEKMNRADFVIINDDNQAVLPQMEKILKEMIPS